MSTLQLATKIKTTKVTQRDPVYIPGRRLGEGAFGEVFMACEQHTGDVYAVKVYKSESIGQWREHGLLSSLEHEHVVRYVAFTHLPGQKPRLIMEYIEGPNLRDFLNTVSKQDQTLLAKSEIQDVLRQLLQAVAYLHAQDVTHRDIKPANIVLAQRNPIRIKVVDFGLATESKEFRTSCGSPLYVAPEMVAMKRPFTNKVDMFSIGVIVLELFGAVFRSRRRGHEARSCLDAVLQQKRQLEAQPQPLPPHFDLAIRLLAERPQDRPSAQECLSHVFFTSSIPVKATETDVLSRLNSASRGKQPDLVTQVLFAGLTTEELATEVLDRPASLKHHLQRKASIEDAGPSNGHQSRHAPSRSQTSQLSSSSSARYKRQKIESHQSVSTSTCLTFVQPGAPSPQPPYREGHNSFIFPDTSSCANVLESRASATSFQVQQDAGHTSFAQGSSPSRPPSIKSSSEASVYAGDQNEADQDKSVETDQEGQHGDAGGGSIGNDEDSDVDRVIDAKSSMPKELIINGHAIATDDAEAMSAYPASSKQQRQTAQRALATFVVGLDPLPLLEKGGLSASVLLGNYLLLLQPLPPQYNVQWLYGRSRHWVANYLRKNSHVARTVSHGFHDRGTYIGLEDAYRLCTALEHDTGPLQAIAARCGLVLGDSQPGASIADEEGDEN
ncbi:hypothetical protein SCUCBS95973_002301 [Sporothrix curviconia]|uniref:Protein kinase domain-containing protein n=1 Tax=Sporothrix curviconia TaxID=1260050 RepID=A0ABP0B617_9PEZI